MQNHKRIPKRSLLGTRVCAPWSDGRFYSGVIQSVTEQPNGQFMYSVLFDDGYSKLYFYKDVVGPGFNSTAGLNLKHGQKVYVTHQTREVVGTVIKHNRTVNEVFVELDFGSGNFRETVKRLDEVRLMESRKSARLNGGLAHESSTGTNSIDCQNLSDHPETGSCHIEVPRNKTKNIRRRKFVEDMIAEESEMGEADGIDSDMQLAAMALQNLSCSPASPHFPVQGLSLSRSPHSWNDRVGSRSTPSPPIYSHYSASAPLTCYYGSASTDEGIEVDDTMYPMDDVITPKRRKGEEEKYSTNIRYKCTWKGCKVVENTCNAIEKHIRLAHLGPREDNLSDHEEDFYYDEVEESELDEMTANMEVMTCASPIQSSPLNLSLPRAIINEDVKPTIPHIPERDHSRKELSLLHQLAEQRSPPILIPGALTFAQKPSSPSAYVVPQNSPYSRQSGFKTGSPLSPATGSPKHTAGSVRKGRSDIKKCRKVYGMENRDRWCTQCKWKKACTRFVPETLS